MVQIELSQVSATACYICVSNWNRTALSKYGVPADKICVIPNGVDLSSFTPRPNAKAKSASNQREEHYDVGYLGRLEYSKGPELLARVVRKYLEIHEAARVLIIGDGSQRELFRHPRITITGFVPHNAVPNLLSTCKMVIVPSRTDSCPAAVLEPCAMGIPVVARAVGGIPELISHMQTGFLCDSEGGLLEGLEVLTSDSALRLRIGTAASIRVQREFGLDVRVLERATVYKRVCDLELNSSDSWNSQAT